MYNNEYKGILFCNEKDQIIDAWNHLVWSQDYAKWKKPILIGFLL